MIRRSEQIDEHVHRAREHQRQRHSFSTTLPGYDTAMQTASQILNLTQNDLDEIMSTTDDSIHVGEQHRFIAFDTFMFRLVTSRSHRNTIEPINTNDYDRNYRKYSPATMTYPDNS
jgi:hypothetical protein